MKKILILLICFLPVGTKAQSKDDGIKFQHFASWKEVLSRAKAEHKNIFIDAYATWCGPCKKMDLDVYRDKLVGAYANQNFISVKLQFDQTENDPQEIKNWYEDVKLLSDQYHIEGFPTFLFLSSNGELISKEAGYQNVNNFLVLMAVANDPKRNYSGKIELFKLGKLPNDDLLPLALKAKEYHDDSISLTIGRKYKHEMIDKAIPAKILNPILLQFLANFSSLFYIRDRIVLFMYTNPEESDSLLQNKGYSVRFTDYIISKSIIEPLIKVNNKYISLVPDWTSIAKKVSNFCDSTTSERLLIYAKINWYTAAKDWTNIIKYRLKFLDTQGIDTTLMGSVSFNNFAYEIILTHSNDQYVLNRTIHYMEELLKNYPSQESWIDTYANLLYKSGRIEEAITNETLALTIAKGKKNDNRIKLYQEILKKMAEKLPTWPPN